MSALARVFLELGRVSIVGITSLHHTEAFERILMSAAAAEVRKIALGTSTGDTARYS